MAKAQTLKEKIETQEKHSFDPDKVRIKKKVTHEPLKVKNEETAYIRILTAPVDVLVKPEVVDPKTGEIKTPEERGMQSIIIDHWSGDEMTFLYGTVLLSELEKSYPDQSYVGKDFAITRHEKTGGKRYHRFSVEELDISDTK